MVAPLKTKKRADRRLIRLREQAGKTQAEFARVFRVSVRTYQYWEATRFADLPGPAQVLIERIEAETSGRNS